MTCCAAASEPGYEGEHDTDAEGEQDGNGLTRDRIAQRQEGHHGHHTAGKDDADHREWDPSPLVRDLLFCRDRLRCEREGTIALRPARVEPGHQPEKRSARKAPSATVRSGTHCLGAP